MPGPSTLIQRVALRNYKSFASCDIALEPLTFVVGANGSGKSNFLDALRFVAEGLRTSLDHALRDRGGINEVRRRSGGHPNHFGIRLDLCLANGQRGFYAFRIGALSEGRYEVQREECRLAPSQALAPAIWFKVEKGVAEWSLDALPPVASADRLFLVNASGTPAFRQLYDALSRMGFYNLNPDRIRELQAPDAGELLARDGGNLASVLSELGARSKASKERIEEYLSRVVPGVRAVDVRQIGNRETLEFRQGVAGSKNPWRFLANSMSDGTLRALGILVALFQAGNGSGPRVSLVGIEEPELALHPGAADLLRDALREGSRRTQVLVTSHSPELLDDRTLGPESILAVVADDGMSTIGPLDEVGRSVLRDSLFTPGELLRLKQLQPEPAAEQRSLFSQARLPLR